MIVKNRLKELRENAGYTTTELAKMANVSQSTITFIENQKRNITIENAIKFCDIFKCSLDTLFLRENYSDAFKEYTTQELERFLSILQNEIRKRKF